MSETKSHTAPDILPKKNQIVSLQITDINHLGYGVGHLPSEDTDRSGMTVFVNGAVPGDEIEAKIIKVSSSYLVGRIERVLRSADCRTETPYCTAPPSCGGCVYRHMTYEAERIAKRNMVIGAFLHAGLRDVTVGEVQTTGQAERYRNKAQYPIRAGKDGLQGGFFARKSHDLIPAASCSLLPSAFSEILQTFCSLAKELGISAYDEQTGQGIVRHVCMRQTADGHVMVVPVINADRLPREKQLTERLTAAHPQIVSVVVNTNRERTNVVLGDAYRCLYGEPYLEDTLCGKRFRISPGSFYQVNHDGAELLYRIAAQKAAFRGGEMLLDLYCGIGTIGLSMSESVKQLVGVEIVPEAVACARENAARNGCTNARFFCGDASDTEKLLADAEAALGHLSPDVVILDPPRKGSTPALLSYLAARRVSKILYISCAPDTLARDCAFLASLGYAVGEVTPVDMFPRTGHVECVVCLTKS